MSAPSDHDDEMLNDTLTDDAIEAFFLGLPEPAWEHEASLAALADDTAIVMNAPPPVADHALLQLFWETPAAAETTPTAVAARKDPVAVIGDSRSVGGFRGRLRLIAGAALGTALALSGAGVAGAAGVLPAPVQRVVAGVVEAISPFELPHSDDQSREPWGGGAVTTGDGTGGQAPTGGQQPTVSTPGSSDDPQATPPASAPSPGPAAAAGSTGLDRAGQTPAGQSIPPFVPGPGAPPNPSAGGIGNAPASGLDTARQTPAVTAPASAPRPPSPGWASSANR